MCSLPDPAALEFAAAVAAMLERHCDAAALRSAGDNDGGEVPTLWARLAELGVPGLTVPERYGGAGQDLTAAVPVLREAGRAAAPVPLVETLAAAHLLTTAGGPLAEQWLPRIAAGAARVTFGCPPGRLVSGVEHADLLLLAGTGGGVRAVPRAQATVRAVPTLDRGVPLAEVAGDGEPLTGADAAAAFDTACVAAAAQLVGLGEAMLAMATRYAAQREQFGRPIGSFQAVKHALADRYVDLAFAGPVVDRAADSVARGLPSRARDASHAKHAATRAARRTARTALQVHGAIGYTYEHDLHLWMKRTWSLAALWGGMDFHRDRVATAVLDSGAPRFSTG